MSYVYNKKPHTDYSTDYMSSLGIDEETQESILSMREYTSQKLAHVEQEWVVEQLTLLDEQEKKLSDGDSRATMTASEISARRIALRDYVTSSNGKLTVNGIRP